MKIKTKKKKKEEQPQKHWEQPRKDFTFLEWIKEDVQKNFRENTLVVSFKQWEIENPFFFFKLVPRFERDQSVSNVKIVYTHTLNTFVPWFWWKNPLKGRSPAAILNK